VPTLEGLLGKTSRTFALSIPVLPEPTRREVTVAYLLFRIADTFEDASHWPPERRIAALLDFEGLLRENRPAEAAALAAAWSAGSPADHEGYRELIAEVPFVLAGFFSLAPGAVTSIRSHVLRSSEGMGEFVAMTQDGRLALSSLPELQRYCHYVAGIVGEMLTDLFLLGRPALASSAGALRRRAATFGEALQLVNVLKDAAEDAAEGRRYLPEAVPVSEVFALARRDLGVAAEYIGILQAAGAPRGLVEFCALPVLLARAALRKVEEKGPGAKVSRSALFLITRRLKHALDRGAPAIPAR
jgi:farnesyl-diphosphate farnesyltransferase